MQVLAQSWLVLQLSNSSVYLGLDVFLGQIPVFLFSLFGGVFADRRNRRDILLASQVIQLVCAFTLAALMRTHVVQVWHIWCLSFTVGLAQSFGGPAYSALIPTLVKKEDLQNAIALELHSVQPGARRRPGAGRTRASEAGFVLVLHAKRHFLPGGDRDPPGDPARVCSCPHTGIGDTQHAGRNRLSAQARRHGKPGGAGFRRHAAFVSSNHVSSGHGARRVSWRSKHIYSVLLFLGRGIGNRSPAGGRQRIERGQARKSLIVMAVLGVASLLSDCRAFLAVARAGVCVWIAADDRLRVEYLDWFSYT